MQILGTPDNYHVRPTIHSQQDSQFVKKKLKTERKEKKRKKYFDMEYCVLRNLT